MPDFDDLLPALNKSKIDGDESMTISSLLEDTLSQDDPESSLVKLHQAVLSSSLAHAVDPLATLPLLLPLRGEGVPSFLNLIGEHSNPKETVIALQESAERLERYFISNIFFDTGDDLEESPGDEEQGCGIPTITSDIQVVRILNLYTSVVPKLPKRKEPPSQVLEPLAKQMKHLVYVSGRYVKPPISKEMIIAVSSFVSSLTTWISGEDDDTSKCKVTLLDLLLTTLEACENGTNAGLATGAFETQFPRYAKRSPEESASSGSRDVVLTAADSLGVIGFYTKDFLKKPSIGSLILLAHLSQQPLGTELGSFLQPIIVSIQTNRALDECLAILFRTLGALKSSGATPPPPEFLVPLVHVLGPLAGSHPDSHIRHLIFRLLSLTLSLAAPPIRFTLLQEMLVDSEETIPPLHVATISLIREAVLEAFAPPVPDQPPHSPFASPTFWQVFRPLIFVAQSLPVSGDANETLSEFLESSEPPRLVESLTLFYLLWQRDVRNRTGVRDPENLKRVNQDLLQPLRSQLDIWKQSLHVDDDDSHRTLQIEILESWIGRTKSIVEQAS